MTANSVLFLTHLIGRELAHHSSAEVGEVSPTKLLSSLPAVHVYTICTASLQQTINI